MSVGVCVRDDCVEFEDCVEFDDCVDDCGDMDVAVVDVGSCG